ncbi:Fe-S cluster assembly protein SufD [Rhodopseudomonas rhenobacensis]|uniref:Fe-S cluster assembly protein SufD n=1 Tax=Rhodopseudomonas rhenobacensis TaxID=87461 RepID=A0A7W7Z0N4_9BRAD|nr:Fe-S cluster assembly protein SufD [Rhodopseudomonas rhenobacensis]MBB5045848.1 Fe-S cluster assembly protein SufD [Rhodopseudomonas rhenobacensis]
MNVAATQIDPAPVASAFDAVRARLPGTESVTERRQASFDAYASKGLPNRRIEDWKYTDLRVLMREVLPLAAAPDQAALQRAGTALAHLATRDTTKLVLVDGVFAPSLSDLAGHEAAVEIRSLAEVLRDDGNGNRADLLNINASADAMISLNAAMATDGVLITVADGASVGRPIHIVHVATQSKAATYSRSFLKLGSAARATFVESFVAAEGAAAYQANDAVVIWLGDGAELQHVRLMEDALDAINISTAVFTVGAKAKLNTFNLTSGGGVSRYQGFVSIGGEGAHVATNGVNLLKGTQHGDTTLVLNHLVPHCTSREVFRAVLDGRGHSVFQGRINVHQAAQKTDAKMMTRALLLSDEAEADNKPELEIFADDVTCGHGSTTGALDESLLFYLRARGLSEKDAQSLLIQAFIGEAIESIADDGLRDLAIAAGERWLEARS